MTGPNEKGRDACNTRPLENHTDQTQDFTEKSDLARIANALEMQNKLLHGIGKALVEQVQLLTREVRSVATAVAMND